MELINNVLRNELWAGQTNHTTATFLQTMGMNVDGMKVAAWKRDRVPSMKQLAQIEAAHQLPRGWVLWRAGTIDIEALTAYQGQEPLPVVPAVPMSLAYLQSVIEDLVARVSLLEQGDV